MPLVVKKEKRDTFEAANFPFVASKIGGAVSSELKYFLIATFIRKESVSFNTQSISYLCNLTVF